ncbi:MAG TPA: hypothetical protein VFU82_05395 [Gammaproteobacteria bacterium]|jgi:hypothetical protein|nr:hypothetical protein [Gammaproteobacteria bacterium]
MQIKTALKPLLAFVGALSLSVAHAADPETPSTSSSYLSQIATNTYNILEQINNLPTYLGNIAEMAASWITTDADENAFITKNQADFASLGYWLEQNKLMQNTMQRQVMATLTGQPLENFTMPANAPRILDVLPNINDLSYSMLLGAPPAPKGGGTPYNYVSNASALNFNHTLPNLRWRGQNSDVFAYYNYYNTVVSIESFDAYVISAVAADAQNGNQVSTLQTTLTNQATSSAWLAQIATEELGRVLRQILLFESQNYVLLTQQLQIQKQQLTAQVMNNSLLILTNAATEGQMLSKAQGLTNR